MFFFRKPNIDTLKHQRDVNGLIKALKHSDWQICRGAAEALAELRSPRAIEALIAFWGSPHVQAMDPTKRADIVGILGMIRDLRVIDVLIDTLSGSHWEVGDRAFQELSPLIETFSKRRDERVIAPLGRVLAIEIEFPAVTGTQASAIKALGEIGGTRAVEMLIRFSKTHPNLRIQAIEALGKLGDTQAVASLISYLQEYLEDNMTGLVKTIEALLKLNWTPAGDDPEPIRIPYLLLTHQWDDLIKIGGHAYPQLNDIREAISKSTQWRPRLELDIDITAQLDNVLAKTRPLYDALLAKGEATRMVEHLRNVRTRFPMIEAFTQTPIVKEKEWQQAVEFNPEINLKYARRAVKLQDVSWLEGTVDDILQVLACCGRLDWKYSIFAKDITLTQSILPPSVPVTMIEVMSEIEPRKDGFAYVSEWDSWSGGVLYVLRNAYNTYRYFFDGAWVPGNLFTYITYTIPKHPFDSKSR